MGILISVLRASHEIGSSEELGNIQKGSRVTENEDFCTDVPHEKMVNGNNTTERIDEKNNSASVAENVISKENHENLATTELDSGQGGILNLNQKEIEASGAHESALDKKPKKCVLTEEYVEYCIKLSQASQAKMSSHKIMHGDSREIKCNPDKVQDFLHLPKSACSQVSTSLEGDEEKKDHFLTTGETSVTQLEDILRDPGFKFKHQSYTVGVIIGGGIPWLLMNEEKWRIHTFLKHPCYATKCTTLLAKNGFVYIGSGEVTDDSVTCFFCNGTLRGWRQEDRIEDVHRALNPTCPMVTGAICNNVPIKIPDNDFSEARKNCVPSGMLSGDPTRIREMPSWMREEKWRLHTFFKYPHNATKPVACLARNGFAYNGSGEDSDDLVTCYCCGATKGGWREEENIEEVHRSLNPDCPMVTGAACNNISIVATPVSSLHGSSGYLDVNHDITGSNIASRSGPGFGLTEEEVGPANRKTGQNTRQEQFQMASVVMKPPAPNIASRPGPRFGLTEKEAQTINRQTEQNTRREQVQMVAVASPSSLRSPNASTNERQILAIAECSNPRHVKCVPQSNFMSHDTGSTRNTEVGDRSSAGVSPVVGHNNLSQPTRHSSVGNNNIPPPSVGLPSPRGTGSPTQSSTPANRGNPPTNQNQSRTVNRARTPTYNQLGIVVERPQGPERYALAHMRLETFKRWPENHRYTAEHLAQAGLYCTGSAEHTRCFSCNIGFDNWDKGTDITIEHIQRSPRCGYIRRKFGQVFVDTVLKLSRDYEEVTLDMVANEMGVDVAELNIDDTERSLRNDPAVQVLKDDGFSERGVIQAAMKLREKSAIFTTKDLLDAVMQVDENPVAASPVESRSEARRLQELEMLRENEKKKLLRLCKVCLDKKAAIVFLPCGHMVCCVDCSSVVKDCPMCRKNVKGVVRAFME